jgi:hypothetical protein
MQTEWIVHDFVRAILHLSHPVSSNKDVRSVYGRDLSLCDVYIHGHLILGSTGMLRCVFRLVGDPGKAALVSWRFG